MAGFRGSNPETVFERAFLESVHNSNKSMKFDSGPEFVECSLYRTTSWETRTKCDPWKHSLPSYTAWAQGVMHLHSDPTVWMPYIVVDIRGFSFLLLR